MAACVAPVSCATSRSVSRTPVTRRAPGRRQLAQSFRRCSPPATPTRVRPGRTTVAAATDGDGEPPKEPERVYDEDGLYIGTYSTFWTDPEQLKGVAIFCTVLAAFFSLGNVGAAIVLPIIYNRPIELCAQAIFLGYPCDLVAQAPL